jgi:hypothetical protein
MKSKEHYGKEEIAAEILAIGLDAIPALCPGTCNQVPGHAENIPVYGRRVFIRRNRALACPVKEKPQSLISVQDALDSATEGIKACDEIIKETLHRKELLEADVVVLEGCQ